MTKDLIVQLPNLLGLVGMVLAGHKARTGWALGVASEFAWAWYAWAAHTPGLYPWCVIWGIIYARNWWAWRKTGRTDAVPEGLVSTG